MLAIQDQLFFNIITYCITYVYIHNIHYVGKIQPILFKYYNGIITVGYINQFQPTAKFGRSLQAPRRLVVTMTWELKNLSIYFMERNVIKSVHSPSVSIKKLLDGLMEQLEILLLSYCLSFQS